MSDEGSAERFMAMVDKMMETAPDGVDATGAALLAAIHLGIGADSRSLSKKLGIAHALVLREITALSGTYLTVTKRDDRTQRTFVTLSPSGEEMTTTAYATSGASMQPSPDSGA
ncbi:hypothetical protein [Agrobacterium sp.]|uniref:hypothetical protein n=1 Tax=Agrobacterium sp. TaxID=361 RepID=UPI0028B1590F|nr:hypothetical protein [Agrobacterium sp.]